MLKMAQISDQTLLLNVKSLVKNESNLTINIVEQLEEIERRKLYSDLKYKNLFDYCTIELGYNEHQAYRRLYAMRIVSDIPIAKSFLKNSSISLSSLNLAGKFFKDAGIIDKRKKEQFIIECQNLSKIDVQKKISSELRRIQIEKDKRLQEEINKRKKISTQNHSTTNNASALDTQKNNLHGQLNFSFQNATTKLQNNYHSSTSIESIYSPESSTKKQKDLITQIDESNSRVHITLKKDTLTKIEKIKGLLAHRLMKDNKKQIDLDELINYLSDVAIEKLEKKKFAVNTQQQQQQDNQNINNDTSKTDDKHNNNNNNNDKIIGLNIISNNVNNRNFCAGAKREIYIRAKGQCEICGSVHKLEIDHIKPFALGGRSDADNGRLVCSNCNKRAAIKVYGNSKMDQYIKLKEKPGDKYVQI